MAAVQDLVGLILLIDDSASVREVLRVALESERHTVIEGIPMGNETTPSDEQGRPTVTDLGDVPDLQFGPYQLLQKIGEGACGEVWLAEQTGPFKRRVAIKIIKLGMDSRQVVARFEVERQALAMMNHPHVARVFDAGTTPRGRSFFVMEHVQGVPITEHCDRHRLPNRERLKLFIQVCEGVQHAHQKAIIHRDLKPSNILVSIQDGRAIPKIIDFGVAKATAQKLTDKTMYTALGALIGTPEYMSPEQAEMTGQDVDTRTDVYSLGVMLYELLVGVLPFRLKDLREAGFDEIRRKIREEEPARPSSRLSAHGDAPIQLATLRRTTLPTLRKELRGDLDWITMKALEKDRTRRYGSPQELAADVERHLRQEPVLAGPPGIAYWTRKFVLRHRIGVALGSAMFLVLLVGMAGVAFGLVKARRAEAEALQEAETSERVSKFMADMLGDVNPRLMGKRLVDNLREQITKAQRVEESSNEGAAAALASLETSLQMVNATDTALSLIDHDILHRASATLEERFSAEPLFEARLRQTIAETYMRLGLYDRAEQHVRRALEISRNVLGEEHQQTLQAMRNLATVFSGEGRVEEAAALRRETLEGRRRVLGKDHPDTLASISDLAGSHWAGGRYAEAEALYREALDAQRRVLGAEHRNTLSTMTNLASSYWLLGQYKEAEALYSETLEISRRVLGHHATTTLAIMQNLADTYRGQRRLAEAETFNLEALGQMRGVLGENHPMTLGSKANLALVYLHQGRYDEAGTILRKAADDQIRAIGKDHPLTLQSLYALGDVRRRQGRYAEAETLLNEAAGDQSRVMGKDHPLTLQSLNALGDVYRCQKRYDEATTLLQQMLDIRRRVLGDEHPDVAESLYALACLAAARGERQKAIDLLRQAVDRGWAELILLADADLLSLRDDPGYVESMNAVRQRLGMGVESDLAGSAR